MIVERVNAGLASAKANGVKLEHVVFYRNRDSHWG
jgi:hypothetical protein